MTGECLKHMHSCCLHKSLVLKRNYVTLDAFPLLREKINTLSKYKVNNIILSVDNSVCKGIKCLPVFEQKNLEWTWARRKTHISTRAVTTTDAEQQEGNRDGLIPSAGVRLDSLDGCQIPLLWIWYPNVRKKKKKKRNQTELFITCEICLFLLCHKELRAARLHGRGCSMAATATGWREVQEKKKKNPNFTPLTQLCPVFYSHISRSRL